MNDDDTPNQKRPLHDREQHQQQQCPSTDGMLELDRLQLNNGATTSKEGAQHHNASLPSSSLVDDDDDDDGDSSDDDGITSSYHPSNTFASTSTSTRSRPQEQCTHFLGQTYKTRTDQIAMHAFQKSLYWMTYRNDLVVPLRPFSGANAQSLMGNLTHGGGLSGLGLMASAATTVGGEVCGMRSDAGWGCMLRSAQMMMAEAVRRHYSPGVGWSKGHSLLHSGQAKGIIAHRSKEDVRRKITNNYQSNIGHHLQNWSQLEDPWEVERIAKWFADFPNHADFDPDADASEVGSDANLDEDYDSYGKGGLNNHWYSLHQMVAAGLGLGILPGEWYGPTTACHVLRELNEIHCERRERLAKSESKIKYTKEEHPGVGESHLECDMFRVHIATEGCIYLDAISKLMTSNSNCGDVQTDQVGDGISCNPPSPKQHDRIDDPLRLPPPSHQKNDFTKDDTEQYHRWDASLLLLLPLRLGIKSISTSDYGSTLAKLLSFPQSVGMLGGTPRHALWFYGADAVEPRHPSSENNDTQGEGGLCDGGWYGLDPHTVQMAPRGTRVLLDTKSANKIDVANESPAFHWQVQLTDTYLRSLHFSPATSHPNHQRSIPLSKLDPSCALGFYIRDHSDLLHFRSLIGALKEEHCRPNKLPEVVTVLEKTPDYEVDVSVAMRGMVTQKGVAGDVDDVMDDLDGFSMQSEDENACAAQENDDDDDDDFVLI